jgi:hypothetical protein
LDTGATLSPGRALARNGSVTLDTNAIDAVCAGVLAPTTLSTQVSSPAVTLGAAISDNATLSGATPSAIGTITFNLYGPNDDNCTETPTFTTTLPVSGNGNYGSGPFTPATAGTYRWIANYSGDNNNAPTANVCNATNESVVVTPVPATSVPTLNEWGAILFMVLAGLGSVYYLRKYRRV